MTPQTLGRMTISRVMEMESAMPLAMIFPQVTADDLAGLAQWYRDDSLTGDPATSLVTLSMHSFVVQLDGQNILIDSCNGNCKTRSVPDIHMLDTPYLENLAKLGLRPQDIHMVLCTHLHMDHVGWNTRLENGRWVPTFPNARYIFGKRDYDHWSTQQDIPPHREAYEDSVLPVVEAGLADIVDTDDPRAAFKEIGDGVWLEPAYGHSPGSCLVHAQGGGAAATFWGDVIHHPVQLLRPDLPLMFDDDGDAAAQVRQSLLARLADTDTLCCPAHFRGNSVGHVRSDGDAYRYDFVG
ncbi:MULTISPECIES: MBL fold metallo-hydrolase [unclassified Sphingobium]|uniref:MBL fold metallo-hydrolase n=1 Tax=unclassified Sphingobium TaxID=2611147 RepID=UPI0022245513|nr:MULTISPECIES: MBL fold metallo-hydrolase [unclassified Sphingobium]MCW2349958.1 glyoxylase-like metal-dependent hydrolase (beta-lactamase superfamily II) [Sphingobium sp. B12D2B]MCW2369059.1 glyoxylase-like metal-dependent hydrolase (beta-lactamase superfamily II) [Sphingobium sp. B11D3D]